MRSPLLLTLPRIIRSSSFVQGYDAGSRMSAALTDYNASGSPTAWIANDILGMSCFAVLTTPTATICAAVFNVFRS